MPKKKTDRAKTSSSAQAFDADVNHINQTKENTKTDVPPVTKKSNKPVGKYRHPDYKLVSVYLKKDTTKSAKKILFDSEKDLSELIEDLLNGWVKKNN